MFDHKHYVPILKGRDGEYGALKNMDASSRSRLTPLIEVPPIPWNFTIKAPQKTLDDHVDKIANKLLKSWGTAYPIFLDTLWLSGSERMKNGSHALSHILNVGRLVGLKIIPVTGFMREDGHILACSEAHKKDKLGVCLRLLREDLNHPELQTEIQDILTQLQIAVSDADLLLDLRALSAVTPLGASDVANLIQRLPWITRWRSLTISGTSFPPSLQACPVGSCSSIARSEWQLWKDLLLKLSTGTRRPTFGDYAIAHPEPSEVDPRIMKASAAIRYTAADSWVVIKGRGLKKYKYDQFFSLARNLTMRPEYRGKKFSWGDEYIDGCGRQVFGKGNLTTWRQVGTSHHLAVVLEQLASLSAA